jgi:quercetin 2,3-dioxygenase
LHEAQVFLPEDFVEYDVLQLTAVQKDSAILIMGGEPLNEPIANHGPFVMNTNLEIQQAMMDYQNNRF